MLPTNPKIFHIVHEDRLGSIVASKGLLCHASVLAAAVSGTTIGMGAIKQRRLTLPLTSQPGLMVGACVPFYFCPRSIMLFLIYRANHPELTYKGGQGPIVHLEADLHRVVAWAKAKGIRWAFTLSNAGAFYFEDRCDLAHLGQVNWQAVQSNQWSAPSLKEGKQAEFLLETFFPWELVDRIGVSSLGVAQRVTNTLRRASHRPSIEIKPDWYY